MKTYINGRSLLHSMTKVFIAKVSEEIHSILMKRKGNYEIQFGGGGTWNNFFKDVLNQSLQYQREKQAMDRKQIELSEAVIEARQAKHNLLSMVSADVLKDREYWKKRAEELEKKLSDIGNISNR
jgi:hypothetical protein